MSNVIDRMMELVHCLPSRDVDIGTKFLNERSLDDLQDLVDSAIIRTSNNLRWGGVPKKEYLDVDVRKLRILKSELDIYITQINLPLIDEEGQYEEGFWID